MKATLVSVLAIAATTVSAFPSSIAHSHLHRRQSPNTWTDNTAKNGVAYDLMADDGSCRSASQIQSDVGFFASQNIGLVRTYDVGCDVGALAAAISAQGGSMKLFAGINQISNLQADLGKLIGMISPYFSIVDTINIGNELVNTGAASVGAVTSALGSARGQLGAAGYSGKIVTVDTFIALMNNPELCIASDYCAANTHAFFDGNVQPEGAGDFVKRMQGLVSQAAGGKHTVVTESGWPHCGNSNGAAVPGYSQQASAMGSIKAAFAGDASDVILFQSFDAMYKAPGANGCEQCWGYNH
jgi:exo-beta-1,3-glucanase (GH17 family)